MTPKQERFCESYIETGNASEAYRQAYGAANMKAATINRRAKELMDNGKITARIEALQLIHSKRHNITLDGLTAQLIADHKLARDKGQASAAVAASMAIARLHGLIVHKTSHSMTNPVKIEISGADAKL